MFTYLDFGFILLYLNMKFGYEQKTVNNIKSLKKCAPNIIHLTLLISFFTFMNLYYLKMCIIKRIGKYLCNLLVESNITIYNSQFFFKEMSYFGYLPVAIFWAFFYHFHLTFGMVFLHGLLNLLGCTFGVVFGCANHSFSIVALFFNLRRTG